MKYITTTILMVLLPLLSISQQVSTSSEIATEAELTQDNIITEVSKNAVSASITVHTYKLNGSPELGTLQNDSEAQSANSSGINSIIDVFLAVQGVTRCTFDKATQTFTLLSEPDTDLSQVVNSINEK